MSSRVQSMSRNVKSTSSCQISTDQALELGGDLLRSGLDCNKKAKPAFETCSLNGPSKMREIDFFFLVRDLGANGSLEMRWENAVTGGFPNLGIKMTSKNLRRTQPGAK